MTYNEALEYIHSVCWMGSRPGLERITELCSLMGNVQDKLKYIHIAGTNGKGSLCSMLTEICKEEGLRVGTFTSPYVFRFNERMAVNGEPISDTELAKITEKIKPLAESMKDKPTEFELITGAALLWFYEKNCDIVILEAGMGGRLDSTNVIKTPVLSVITSISLDHTSFLGDTEEKIAYEKAGIIKEGVPCIYGKMKESCAEVIKERANELGSAVQGCDYGKLSNIYLSADGASFDFEGFEKRFKLNLAGGYQPYNAALAISCANTLGFSKESIYKGLKAAKWRARFEILSKDPYVIYDGGHNPDGVDACVKTVKELFEGKINILSGVMADKDYHLITELLKPVAHKAFCVTPNNPRALASSDYAKAFEKAGIPALAFDDMSAALKAAYNASKNEKRPLLAMGSLYMYEEFINEYSKY
ncbi:MAG: bifunctional folylpolyglutamate synthase/dihydrofolate synthase [Clostridia bacterium]|nr:bifunctional folylpolyglutamate synthase/dihydrofolate synthase [Clostridia bacterium]